MNLVLFATDINNSIKIEVWEVSESYLDKIENLWLLF